MPLPDTFNVLEVNDAVAELKACLDDAKQSGIFQHLVDKYLPRLTHILTHNKVIVSMLDELPKVDRKGILNSMEENGFGTIFSVDPKMRLSQHVTVLILAGENDLDLWILADNIPGRRTIDFWQEFFFPTARDLMRHAVALQTEFAQRKKSEAPNPKGKMSAPTTYALDLFISHSSKDKRLAKALIELLRAALAIPHERIRCTSVAGYKLFGGAKTESELKKEIRGAHGFIGLITPDSLTSQFVLFELGARWGLDEHLLPVLGSGITAEALRPPLSNLNALNTRNKSEMEQLVHDLAKILKKPVPLPAVYETQISKLLKTESRSKTNSFIKQIEPA